MSDSIRTTLHTKPLPYSSDDGIALDVHAIDNQGNFFGITPQEADPFIVLYCAQSNTTHQTPISQINQEQFHRIQTFGIEGLNLFQSVAEEAVRAIHRIRNSSGTRLNVQARDIPNILPHKLCGRTF